MAVNKELVAASAGPMVLSILSQGESYGYEIIKRVRGLSGGQMEWTDGMLYPVLHRLEGQGLIRSRWRVSETGRKRKYYYMNKKGVKALKSQQTQWIVVYSTLRKLWEREPCLT
ncbi:MAG: PadR family transcriptional regulator [Planctomycetota bacterium]|jgi:DNA-binding PadR family transcriptional regulator